MEAMAAGRPVICLALGGPTILVTDETGFKITARNPDQTVAELAEYLTIRDINDLWRQMGNHARQQVQQNCCWPNKVKVLSKLYREHDKWRNA